MSLAETNSGCYQGCPCPFKTMTNLLVMCRLIINPGFPACELLFLAGISYICENENCAYYVSGQSEWFPAAGAFLTRLLDSWEAWLHPQHVYIGCNAACNAPMFNNNKGNKNKKWSSHRCPQCSPSSTYKGPTKCCDSPPHWLLNTEGQTARMLPLHPLGILHIIILYKNSLLCMWTTHLGSVLKCSMGAPVLAMLQGASFSPCQKNVSKSFFLFLFWKCLWFKFKEETKPWLLSL